MGKRRAREAAAKAAQATGKRRLLQSLEPSSSYRRRLNKGKNAKKRNRMVKKHGSSRTPIKRTGKAAKRRAREAAAKAAQATGKRRLLQSLEPSSSCSPNHE